MTLSTLNRRARSSFAGCSDAELLSLTRSGVEEAFGALWDRHRSAGLRAAASISGRHESDDLLQEAFLRILTAIRAGSGPTEAFRPYLYSTLRSISIGWSAHAVPESSLDTLYAHEEPSYTFEGQLLDGTITTRAFAGLRPEWRTALWYSEVEGMTPRAMAPILGLTPNATSALLARAREGLRASWLQAHLNADIPNIDCRWVVERLGIYHRGSIGTRDRRRVDAHLEHCDTCPALVAEVSTLGRDLAVALLPLFLGIGSVAAGAWSSGASAAVHGVGGLSGALGVAATVVLIAGGAVAGITLLTQGNGDGVPVAAPSAIATPPAQTAEPTEPGLPVAEEQPPEHSVGTVLALVPVRIPEMLPVTIETQAPATVVPELPLATTHLPVPPAITPHPTPAPTVPVVIVPEPSQTPTVAPTPTPSPTAPATVEAPDISLTAENPPYLPTLGGRGTPGALISVVHGTEEVATATVATDGTWSAAPSLTVSNADPVSLTATQTLDGVTSASAALAAPITITVPEVQAVTIGTSTMTVTFSGIAGHRVEAFLDGNATGNLHLLTETPLTRELGRLSPGPHTISLRYVDPATGATGATLVTPFTVPTVPGRVEADPAPHF